MAIPDFQSLMLPLLKWTADGRDHSRKDAAPAIADQFGLTAEEQAQLLPSKRQEVFINRLHWARFHLARARLLESPRHGVFRITARGMDVLRSAPPTINMSFLNRYPEYAELRSTTNAEDTNEPAGNATGYTPEETIEIAFQQRRGALATELLELVKQATPGFFERLVVELLVAMGYGGSRADAGQALGKTGDEGVDGIIKEDRLGLDVIYLQAKRWTDRTVGRPEIQQFAGALHGQRARKGVFITASTFSREAREFASRIDSQIILIDGSELASLMIDHNVGVALERTYEIKRVDTDFFIEE